MNLGIIRRRSWCLPLDAWLVSFLSFSLFFWYVAFSLSTIYHTFSCKSRHAWEMTFLGDLAGIILCVLLSTSGSLYMGYACFPQLRFYYMTAIIILGLLLTTSIFGPSLLSCLDSSKWKDLRTALLVLFACFGFLPLTHWIFLNGVSSLGLVIHPFPFLSSQSTAVRLYLWRVLRSYLLLGVGFVFWILKIPERFSPGSFDYLVFLPLSTLFSLTRSSHRTKSGTFSCALVPLHFWTRNWGTWLTCTSIPVQTLFLMPQILFNDSFGRAWGLSTEFRREVVLWCKDHVTFGSNRGFLVFHDVRSIIPLGVAASCYTCQNACFQFSKADSSFHVSCTSRWGDSSWSPSSSERERPVCTSCTSKANSALWEWNEGAHDLPFPPLTSARIEKCPALFPSFTSCDSVTWVSKGSSLLDYLHSHDQELEDYGHIYMYRFRPDEPMFAHPIDGILHLFRHPSHAQNTQQSTRTAEQSNWWSRITWTPKLLRFSLDIVSPLFHDQFPHELITYGGNGAVFSNWAQFRLVMKYPSLFCCPFLFLLVSEWNDRSPDFGDVQWTPSWTLSIHSLSSTRCHYQRNGHS